ncbi:hypothetical protein NESM_000850200 [Novymonas esmeraldas]|uniref:Uncharacterized protein n=1 Tax=Novymonas esmeraldas TaxID=1808958 RepID=A0AAW0EX22_9TRYP
MSDLRSAPGYSKMEDYYDSDYVPHDLLDRYHVLQLELRRRTEQRFTALSQANGLAATYDGLAATSSLPHLTATTSSSTGPTNEQLVLPASLRSPHRALRKSSSISGAVAERSSRSSSSVNRHAPRLSMQLEEVFAARERTCSSALTRDSAALTASASSSAAVDVVPGSAALRPPSPARHVQRRPRPRVHKKMRDSSPAAAAAAREPSPPPSDLYDAVAEARRQEQFLSESRRLGRPFVPSGSSALDVPTRFMLGDCVKMLYRTIAPHWRIATPMVVSTAEDLIAVYFSIERLAKDQVTALLHFMNSCLKYNDAVREFHLSKVAEGWDVLTNDGHILYTFRPPWVKKRAFLPDTVTPPHAHV